MVSALLKRALAIAFALLTITLTAGLSPQAAARPRPPQAEPPPTPSLGDVEIIAEVARLHSRPGPLTDVNAAEPPSGGLVHVVGPGETLQSIALDYRLEPGDVLDANGLRTAGQVRPGLPLRLPGAKPLTSAPLVKGGQITYRASEEDHFPWGWCTWYVAQRRDVPWRGDARTWFASARALGWPTGQTPQAGAMMVTNESYAYGHVAYVEKVYPDGSWLVSEMNYDRWGAVDFRTIRPSQVPKQVPLIGFIY